MPLLPYAEALQVLEARLGTRRPGTEDLPLVECVGRVLAAPASLDRNEPPVDRSAMDGFAMCSTDGVRDREIVGTVYAGTAGRAPLRSGQAVAVMTGGTVPQGADCVVPVERTRREGDRLLLEQSPHPGQHVRRAGEMGASGRILLQAGQRLRVADLGALAGCGVDPVRVFQQPRAVVLSTGDEVVSLREDPAPHQVRDSNRLLACLQLRSFGAVIVDQRHVLDEPDSLREAVADALQQADLVVTIGGVSMGDKDFLPQVFQNLGVRRLFHKIALQPGKPVWAGEKEGCLVLGLPGNPLSSFVVLELLGRLIVDRMEGGTMAFPRPLRMARLRGRVRCGSRPRLLPARFEEPARTWPTQAEAADTLPWLVPCTESGSGDWTSLATATVLLYLTPKQEMQDGASVFYLPLDQP